MPQALNLRLQASVPSNHVCPTFLLPTPPQRLNQAPPGAQQLTLPDFLNVPHLGHVIVSAIDEGIIVIGVRTISSRSGNGRRVTMAGVGAGTHVVREIDPNEPANMPSWRAVE